MVRIYWIYGPAMWNDYLTLSRHHHRLSLNMITFIDYDSKSPAENHSTRSLIVTDTIEDRDWPVFLFKFKISYVVRICAKSLTIHLQIDREIEVSLMNWIELDKLMRQSVSQAADSQDLKWIIWIMNVGCMLWMYEKSSRFLRQFEPESWLIQSNWLHKYFTESRSNQSRNA